MNGVLKFIRSPYGLLGIVVLMSASAMASGVIPIDFTAIVVVVCVGMATNLFYQRAVVSTEPAAKLVFGVLTVVMVLVTYVYAAKLVGSIFTGLAAFGWAKVLIGTALMFMPVTLYRHLYEPGWRDATERIVTVQLAIAKSRASRGEQLFYNSLVDIVPLSLDQQKTVRQFLARTITVLVVLVAFWLLIGFWIYAEEREYGVLDVLAIFSMTLSISILLSRCIHLIYRIYCRGWLEGGTAIYTREEKDLMS